MNNPDYIIQNVLLALRSNRPPATASDDIHTCYRYAAMQVFNAIEAAADPDQLWDGGETVAELTTSMNLGRHLAATRRFFGLIS